MVTWLPDRCPRSPTLTFATKKLLTGANGQKEDAASFFCPRIFDRAVMRSNAAATLPALAKIQHEFEQPWLSTEFIVVWAAGGRQSPLSSLGTASLRQRLSDHVDGQYYGTLWQIRTVPQSFLRFKTSHGRTSFLKRHANYTKCVSAIAATTHQLLCAGLTWKPEQLPPVPTGSFNGMPNSIINCDYAN